MSCDLVPQPKNEELALQHAYRLGRPLSSFLIILAPAAFKSGSRAPLHPHTVCWGAEDGQPPSHQDLVDTELEVEPLK